MALRDIRLNGDQALRKKCRPVTDFGRRTAELMDDLRDTMQKAEGAGLAAPQVGILRRACVILNGEDVVELINPEIIARSAEQVGVYEGCLSCPNMRGYLLRPKDVTVRAQDREGNWFELTCSDIAARAVCHETEHLDGKLFIDQVEHIYTDEELMELLAEEDDDEEEEDGE